MKKGRKKNFFILKDNITGLFKIRYKGIEYTEVESNNRYISLASKESGILRIEYIFKKGKEIYEIDGYINKNGDVGDENEPYGEFDEHFEWKSLTRKERNNYLLFSSTTDDKTIFHGVCPRDKLSIKKMLNRLKIGEKNSEEDTISYINRIYDNETLHIGKYSVRLVPMYP